jgi:hypothetical protein
MSLASAPVAAVPPARGASASRRRGAIQSTAASGAGLGAGEGMGALSRRLLRASSRRGVVGGAGGRRAVTVQAKSLEERIASGEFTKPRTSIGETVLNGMREALKSVESPQSECSSVFGNIHRPTAAKTVPLAPFSHVYTSRRGNNTQSLPRVVVFLSTHTHTQPPTHILVFLIQKAQPARLSDVYSIQLLPTPPQPTNQPTNQPNHCAIQAARWGSSSPSCRASGAARR